jgi:DNA-binding winged helix-turn-helix (wHTH) protein
VIPQGVYVFGEFHLKRAERVLERDGAPVPLAPKAMDVLIALIGNRGRLMEKDTLMREVWPDTFVEENSLAFNVSVLRKALGDRAGEARYIEMVPKRGYRFVAEVTESKEAPDAVAAVVG